MPGNSLCRIGGGLRKRVCVIDGQGGGIGVALIKALKLSYGETIELIALGTNAVATSQMMRAGASRGASGENAIIRTVQNADLIIGSIAVTWANAMLGEVTPRMAEAAISSSGLKILFPLTQERVEIVGIIKEPLPHMIEAFLEGRIKEVLKNV